MALVTASDGKRIWYDVTGEGEPLVLIGGSSLVHRQWDFMLPILRDHFRVILYDQRGAGLSDRTPSGVTLEQWVDDLERVLHEVGIRKTHIFATSNGSLIAIRFAAKYPESTGALIHYGIYKFTDQYRGMSKIGAAMIDEFGLGKGDLGAYFLARMFGAPPSFEGWVAKCFEENLSAEAWKAAHRALDVDLTQELPKIKSPQLVLIGGRGPLGKDTDYASGWKELRESSPGAEFAVIQDAEGTFLVLTHPVEVAKEVIGFIERHRITG